MRQKLILTTLA